MDINEIIKSMRSKMDIQDARVEFDSIQVSLLGLSEVIEKFQNEFDTQK